MRLEGEQAALGELSDDQSVQHLAVAQYLQVSRHMSGVCSDIEFYRQLLISPL